MAALSALALGARLAGAPPLPVALALSSPSVVVLGVVGRGLVRVRAKDPSGGRTCRLHPGARIG